MEELKETYKNNRTELSATYNEGRFTEETESAFAIGKDGKSTFPFVFPLYDNDIEERANKHGGW